MPIALTLLATIVALAGAGMGLALASVRESTPVIVPFSGGILLGVAAFDLLPELLRGIGWIWAPALFAAGYGILMLVDRCEGVALPLLLVAAVHAFFDGWGISTAAQSSAAGIRVGVPIAVLLHKLPEGISLGGITRRSAASRWRAFGWCAAAESATIFGGGAGLAMMPRVNVAWIGYPLAIAGGGFVYLGLHAVEGEWKRRGTLAAFLPAVMGLIGAAAIAKWSRMWIG